MAYFEALNILVGIKGIKDPKQHWKVTRNYNAIISIVNQCLTVSGKNKSSLIPALTGLQGLLLANNLLLF